MPPTLRRFALALGSAPVLARGRAGLLALALAGVVGLAGCAAGPATAPFPTNLLHDALFQHPPHPAGAEDLLSASPAMREWAQALRQRARRPADLPQVLADALGPGGGLRLHYDASRTRSAAEAFADRAGNCLSLVLMTAALSEALGLAVEYREVAGAAPVRQADDLTLRTGHVNLVLGEASPGRPRLTGQAPAPRLLIDFLPEADLAGLPAETIGLPRVRAMFMNNRAVEALLVARPTEAYAWVRAALRAEPAFLPAWNTLGVVYQRGGHLEAAGAAFEQLLQRDPADVAAMANLAQVREAQGRPDEAAHWTRRRLALEPHPPLHFLRLGQAALDAGDWGLARQHLKRELRLHGDSAQVLLALARAHLAGGEAALAEQALRRAQAVSATPAEQARLAAKLGALRGSRVQ